MFHPAPYAIIVSPRGGPRPRLRPIFGRDPVRFLRFYSFLFVFSFSLLVTKWDFEDFPDSGRRPFVFRISSYFRFHSFSPFDAIWPARQGRLPCLGREGWRRHFAFDSHIEMIQIRPFGLKFCLRPAGTLSFFVFLAF